MNNLVIDFLKVRFIQPLSDIFHHLSLRERVIILAVALLFVFMVWYSVYGNFQQQLVSAIREKENLQEVKVNQEKTASTENKIQEDIAVLRKKIASTQSKVDTVTQDIERLNRSITRIDEAVLILRDLLEENKNLKLINLKTFPPEKVEKQGELITGSFEKNSISLSFTGSYIDIFEYIKRVESLKWSVFWENLSYKVNEYPKAVVEIRLYTLSIIGDEK